MNESLTQLHPRVFRRDQRRFIYFYVQSMVEQTQCGY